MSNEISLINSFLKGSNSGFSNIIVIHHPMCYQCRARSQWITAYHSAILILSGCPSLRLAMVVPSIIVMTSFCFIYIFVVQTIINMANPRLTKSNSTPLFLPFVSLFLLLNLSGMGFFRWFYAVNRNHNFVDFVSVIGKDETTNWLHPILQYILSYRSSPFILHISSSIILLFMSEERCFKKKRSHSEDISNNNNQNDSNKKQSLPEYDNNNSIFDSENISAKPTDEFNENRYQIKQVQKQNEYSLIGTLLGLTVPLQHQGFFSIGMYVILYIIVEFVYSHIAKAVNKNKVNISLIFSNLNIPSIKLFFINFGNSCKADFIDTFFSPAIQKMIVCFAIISSVSLIQYRKTGMDLDWIHREVLWSDNIKQGSFFPSIVQWYSNLGLYPLFVLIFVWFFLDVLHIKFLLPTVPIFIIGNYISFQSVSKYNFLFFYPTWGLVSCIFVPIALQKLTNLNFVKTEENKKNKSANEEIQGVFLGFSILFLLSCTLSSLMGINRQWKKKSPLWGDAEDNVADYIIHNTKKNDVFLTTEGSYDPVSLLAGRTSFKMSNFHLFAHNKVWFLYNDDIQKLRQNPNLGILPMITFYLEHSRRDNDKHLKKPDMNQSWSLCFRYESYNLYNRTIHEK